MVLEDTFRGSLRDLSKLKSSSSFALDTIYICSLARNGAVCLRPRGGWDEQSGGVLNTLVSPLLAVVLVHCSVLKTARALPSSFSSNVPGTQLD